MAASLEPSETAGRSASRVAELLTQAGLPVVDGDHIPMFNAAAIAAAVVDRTGRVVCASPAFVAMRAERHVDPGLLDKACRGAPAATAVVELATDDGAADTAIFAYGPAVRASAWRLPPEVKAAATERHGHAVILTSQSTGAEPLEAACRAYGLSGLQTRAALETIRAGSARLAAESLGISYETAREALAAAMARVRVQRLSVLVSRLTSLAFGVLPEADAAEMLADLWGLTPRQAAIAGLVADGVSRKGVAAALSISEAVVRKELEQIYLMLQVSSGAALARKVVEANALRWLTQATGGDIGFLDTGSEPLQFVHRADGSRIALSDYGPASGKPVLVVHSSMTTRIVARSLLRALQAAGYRPISIDRPGFGLTDEVAGMRTGRHDPYVTAAQDTLLVLEQLKIRSIDLVARGGAQFVLALARTVAPGRLGRVVLVNPAPHTAKDDRNVGPLGVIKEAFRRNPAMIRLAAAAFIRQRTFERLANFLERSMRGSPPDEAAVRDPELVRDYFHATRTFATGRYGGYVNEQTEFAQGSRPPPLAATTDWRVLVAAHDVLHDPQHVLAYWQCVLPDARFELVPDTGRLMALSHPDRVVEALRAA